MKKLLETWKNESTRCFRSWLLVWKLIEINWIILKKRKTQ
jgi:hypothetical protein